MSIITTNRSFRGSDPVPHGVFKWEVHEQTYKGDPSTFVVTQGPATGQRAWTLPGPPDSRAMKTVHSDYLANHGEDNQLHRTKESNRYDDSD